MMDLHSHSIFSDGSDTVEAIIGAAKQEKLALCAVTDHDCLDGVGIALEEGKKQGISVLTGIELSSSTDDLHIVGYGFNPNHPALVQFLANQEQQRVWRNEKIIQRLEELGVPIQIERDAGGRLISRTHMAAALIKGGYVQSMDEAFAKYLGPTGSANINFERLEPKKAVEIIHSAGGMAVMAHPGLLKEKSETFIASMITWGIDGLEVYYPSHTAREIVAFRKIALENDIWMTTGSDYHGKYRRQSRLGSMAELASFDECLQKTEAFLLSNINEKGELSL